MANSATGSDRLRAILVIVATVGTIVFNWLAATGRLGGITPGFISDRYATLITPADYAFTIWSLIYLGTAAFSVYQLLPANMVRMRSLRSLYIGICSLNCAWLYFWLGGRLDICLIILSAMWLILIFINFRFRNADTLSEYWMAKAPFNLYLGWMTAAWVLNLAVLLASMNIELSTLMSAFILILFGAAAIGLRTWLDAPLTALAAAWAAAAIGVQQSGKTGVVVAAAIVTIACLIASLTFILRLPTRKAVTE
ncbi:MAG: tryptophan-rich sensory protein [Acidobacteria bacterium]|nr:tryptophan-rich sensory protein [Acidobacteriota bacterium]